ncbi:MAG: M48 family metalloprotease, partial [Planctomycetaceae bacterium]|nr:M48 family metalloprotease [Planctomycetaceae bacterium]
IAIASGTRVPRVYILRQEKGVNSFSAGWNPDEAVLCVTQGFIDQLSRDEQQAVVAHEFSHILNGDIRLNMWLMGLLVGSHILIFFSWGAISTLVGLWLLFGLLPRGLKFVISDLIEMLNIPPDYVYVAVTLVFGLAAIYFFHLVYLIFLKLAIARRRVFLADTYAVQWTRHPAALISALRKIEDNQHGSHILHSRSGSVAHMTFASVFRGRSISQWFDTHPSVKRRIRAIESRRELWPKEPKREPKPELTQDPLERKARDWSSDGTTRDIPLDLATVADLLLAIPSDIRQLAADTETVMPLVFALLLDAGEEIRRKQLAIIERITGIPTRERTREIAAKTDPLAGRLRPTLAEITFPTLRDLSPEQYTAFRETVNALIRADGKVDLFEYTFNARLLTDLDRHFRRIPEARVMYHSTQAVLDPFAVVLSAVAYAGNRGDGQLMPSYNEGMHVFGHRKPILPSKDCTLREVDVALKKLCEASPAVKRRIMRALAACVMADDYVTVRERETLRAIAAMLNAPLPTMA